MINSNFVLRILKNKISFEVIKKTVFFLFRKRNCVGKLKINKIENKKKKFQRILK